MNSFSPLPRLLILFQLPIKCAKGIFFPRSHSFCSSSSRLPFFHKNMKSSALAMPTSTAARGNSELGASPASGSATMFLTAAQEWFVNLFEESGLFEATPQENQLQDEMNCQYMHNCPPGYFICRNGDCIPAKMRCDGLMNCLDNSDERDCFGGMAPRVPYKWPNRANVRYLEGIGPFIG